MAPVAHFVLPHVTLESIVSRPATRQNAALSTNRTGQSRTPDRFSPSLCSLRQFVRIGTLQLVRELTPTTGAAVRKAKGLTATGRKANRGTMTNDANLVHRRSSSVMCPYTCPARVGTSTTPCSVYGHSEGSDKRRPCSNAPGGHLPFATTPRRCSAQRRCTKRAAQLGWLRWFDGLRIRSKERGCPRTTLCRLVVLRGRNNNGIRDYSTEGGLFRKLKDRGKQGSKPRIEYGKRTNTSKGAPASHPVSR